MTLCRRCGGTGHEPDWRKLGRMIRTARERLGWTKVELARLTGVSAQYVGDLEGGRRAMQGPKARRVLTKVGLL